jgi:hypothetical protein
VIVRCLLFVVVFALALMRGINTQARPAAAKKRRLQNREKSKSRWIRTQAEATPPHVAHRISSRLSGFFFFFSSIISFLMPFISSERWSRRAVYFSCIPCSWFSSAMA